MEQNECCEKTSTEARRELLNEIIDEVKNEPPRGKPFPHSASLHIGGVSRSFALESWETNGFPNPPLMEPRSKLTG